MQFHSSFTNSEELALSGSGSLEISAFAFNRVIVRTGNNSASVLRFEVRVMGTSCTNEDFYNNEDHYSSN